MACGLAVEGRLAVTKFQLQKGRTIRIDRYWKEGLRTGMLGYRCCKPTALFAIPRFTQLCWLSSSCLGVLRHCKVLGGRVPRVRMACAVSGIASVSVLCIMAGQSVAVAGKASWVLRPSINCSACFFLRLLRLLTTTTVILMMTSSTAASEERRFHSSPLYAPRDVGLRQRHRHHQRSAAPERSWEAISIPWMPQGSSSYRSW